MRKTPGSGKFREEGSRPREALRRLQPAGKKGRRPQGLQHLRVPANAASQERKGPRLPAGDLPAHRLVGQLAHAIELLLHRGPAAALAREQRKNGAARSPPQGYMAPVRSFPGDGGGTAEPPGASGPGAAPSRGHYRLLLLPLRSLLLHPRHAPPGAFIVKPGVRLSALQVFWAVHPQPQSRAGTRESPAGWRVHWPGGPRCACADDAVHSGTCSFVPPAPTFPLTKVCKYSGDAEVGEGCVLMSFAPKERNIFLH